MSIPNLMDALDGIEDLMVRADEAREQRMTNGCLILAVQRLAAIVKDQAQTIAQLEARASEEARR